MKISKRHLRRIIREVVGSAGLVGSEHQGADYVAKMMTTPAAGGPNVGIPFRDIAMTAIEKGDFRVAANAVMSALWIDDPWPEDEEALEEMMGAVGADPDHLTQVAWEWLEKFRADGYASEEQKQGHLRSWG